VELYDDYVLQVKYHKKLHSRKTVYYKFRNLYFYTKKKLKEIKKKIFLLNKKKRRKSYRVKKGKKS